MNRNVESHFSELPKVDIERSRFDRSSSHKTSFNVGQLIPIYVDEVLPGDTFKMTTSLVARLQTLLTPIMDNMYLDTYYFFVPNRIVWTHWKEFMGENSQSAWAPTVDYRVPLLSSPDDGWNVGSLADYFGIPVNPGASLAVNALPFRDYALIVNEFFRDQNVQDPLNIEFGDSLVSGSNGDNYVTDVAKGGKPFVAAKYHDYFTSCLPSPQKGPAISIFGKRLDGSGLGPFGESSIGASFVPVHSRSDYITPFSSDFASSFHRYNSIGSSSVKINDEGFFNINASSDSNWAGYFSNLWADVSELELSINQLRLSFQLQKFFERQARGGTRYRELLLSHFGVVSPDASQQVPEYLGGHRIPLSIHQVANQSQGENEFLGDLGAMSNTSDVHEDFVKSFTEHGFIIGLAVVRYDHSYPQGLERLWSKSSPLDFYWPVFANIGEQPVYKKELFFGPGDEPEKVFGYQEAWAEYRFKPSRVSGEMRPGVDNSLASWHLADYYTTVPSLSSDWIQEDKTNVDRTLAVTSAVSNQIFADFYFDCQVTRPMPMYSIPGLIDHH